MGGTILTNSGRLLFAVVCILSLPSTVCQTYTNPSTEPHVFVNEDTSPGTAVTNITDNDPNGRGRIARIDYLGSDYAFYAVKIPSEPKWKVFLNRTLDYDRGVRTISVSFHANGGSANVYASPVQFMFHVDDVNDNHPEFHNLPYNAEVNESTPIDSVIYTTVQATDIDTGLGGVIDYSFEPVNQGNAGAGQPSKFRMDARTGNVTLNGTVDYESKTFYHYIVTVKDRGNPPLSSTTDLFITVKDVQDSPPVFTNLPYVQSVDEDAPMSFSVLKVKAVDQDRAIPNEVAYSMTASTCPGSFQINSSSGEISVAGHLDRDSSTIMTNNGVCVITVEATEEPGKYPQQGNFTAVARATITVNDINDNAPSFSSGTTFSATISENSPSGTPLQLDNNEIIEVRDIDQGSNSQIHLSLLGRNISDTFELVTSVIPSSGSVQLRVKNSAWLNFEEIQTLSVRIQATDNKYPAVNATVTVHLLNVNEFSPVFKKTDYTGTVPELSGPGTSVATLRATDADAGEFGDVKYSLRNDRGIFQIHADSGLVTVASNGTDREKVDFYYMLVIATDGGNRTSAVSLTVTITDINDNSPVFQRNQYDAFLDEGKPAFDRPVTVQATDADEANTENSNVTYSIVSSEPIGQTGHFSVNAVTGQLRVTSALDFEAITFPPTSKGVVKLIVQALDNGSPSRLSATATVAVILADVNDKTPSFQNAPYSTSIPEDSRQGKFVLQVNATDADGSNPNNVITYSIERGGQDRFRIDPDNGTITVSSGLDREQTQSYTLIVVAKDRAAFPKSESSSVTIVITDVNDEPPTFGANAEVRLDQNELFHGVLYNMNATDPDTDNQLKYSILYNRSSGQSGNSASLSQPQIQTWVAINSSTGQIYTKKPLDRLQVHTLRLHVQVTDTMGTVNQPQTSTGTVTINVQDVDNHAPVFSKTSLNISVDENAADGILFTMPSISVTDLDEGEYSQFTLTVAGIDSHTIVVVPSSDVGSTVVVLRVGSNNSLLDYEANPVLHFQLVAEGQENTSMKSVCNVTLNINNINDNQPKFPSGQSYNVSIPENSPNGTSVTTVSAIDEDEGTFGHITYSILGGNDQFTISENGEVTVAQTKLDYEQRNEYQMTVEATDTGGRSASVILSITVLDVNDEIPTFSQLEYQAFVKENELKFDQGVIVKAEDSDGPGGNSEVYYSFPPSLKWSANFSINDTSGQLVLESPLDYEALSTDSKGVITLEILASDRGTPHPLTGSATIKVTVQDINDNAPVFTSMEYSGNISENKGPDVSVVQVNATDNDRSSPNKDVFYIIASGGNDRFRVNSTSGEITTVTDLDRENTSNYTLTVLAMDRGSPALTGTTTVSVFVKNINDDPPQFRPSQISVSFKETSRQAVIKELPVIDLDEDASLSYQIAWNTSEGLDPQQRRVSTNVLKNNFMMLPNSNTLMTSARGLDRESVESANLVIVVTDINAANGTHQTAQGTVRIQVEDADDNSPQFSRSVFNANLTEGSPRGTPLQLDYEMTVTDIDKDENSEFHLTLSKYGNCLEVIPEHRRSEATVLIRVKNKSCFDYEDKELMEFEVIATGEQNTSRTNSASVNLNILNINDVTPVFNHSSYAVSVPENLAISSSVIRVQAVDLDKPPFDSFNYSIQGGDGVFKISESGEVTVAKNELDYELRKEYQLTVEATDTGGRRASARLVITVEDVNDQIPRFIRPEYQAFVKEKEPDFDRDVIVKAEDSDGPGGNSEVYYSFPPSLKWSANFSINDTSGQLVLESPLDYETLSTDSKGIITLEIMASDRGTPHPLTGSATIKVTVQDVNDNAPVFTSTEYSGNISENKGPDVSVVQVNATDNDRSSPNKDVFYIIASGGNDRFRVNSTSGEITTVTDLDREDTSNYTLTVLAMDRGSPALTGTTTVSVFVKNINDDPPQFRPSQISVSFKETSRQAVIKELPVIDLDEDASLSYQIAWNTSEGLDPQQRRVSTNVLKSNFMMLPNSNTLMTSAMGLDRESVESANLVIVVTDINAANGTHQTAQGTVRIQVEDADDNSPQFSRSVFNANLTEGSPRGTPLQLDYEMTVTDIDKDENSEFHLTLSKYGNCLEVIPEHRRSEATVLIRVKNKSCFDYEDKELMEFEVIATGEQNASRTNSASVHLNILNVNDVTPVFNHSSYAVSVPENLAISSSVISVQAVDLDKPPFDSFNYSIQGGDGVFKISESGEVTVAKNELDYELRKEYQLTVEATDTGGRRASARLVITVEDVNDQNPRFIRPEYQAFVKEKEPDFDRDVIVKAEDSDGPGGNSEVYYSFPPSLKWSANFSINDTSGQLVLESPLDYEALSTDSKGVITLEILASDRGTPHPLTGSATIKVTVQDVNDNAPVFTSTEYSGNISENKGPDVSVVQVNATDNDRSSPNKDVFYIIASGGNDRFRVNSTSGEITTVTDLDREDTSNYTLTVLAMDRGSPALTGTTTVSVFVKNINDDPPQFRPSQISVSFKETSRQAVIKELPVIDLDEDASLSYQIAWNTSEGLDPQQRRVSTNVLKSNFMMLPNSNTLMTSAMGLDRESVESANLVIVVTDINAANGTHQTAQGTVRIQVEDADDNSPQFSRSVFNANLTEGSPRGTPLQLDYEMTVTDIDKDENSEFHLTLSKYGNCLEVIPEHRRSEATVLIRVKNKSCFDYEDKELMEFEVIATGEQNASRTNSASVHLNILNVNDVTPVFNHSSYAVSVPENLAISSSVISVQAVDLDKPPFDSFNYSIQGGDGVFKISESGEVTVAKNELDYELRKEYQLTVEATDTGGRRASARLVITVEDVNDQNPRFIRPEYQAFVKEKEPDFDRDVIVKAEDSDGPGGNSEVYYSFPPSLKWSANFSINDTSGQLVLESPLDYEALSTDSKGVITLEILASDRGTPHPLTGSATIKVTVQDVNDNAPVFTSTEYSGNISENKGPDVSVVQVNATDNDRSSPNKDVFYIIASGGNDRFRVNSTSGEITTVTDLDREDTSNYTLTVLAMDRGSPALTGTTTVSVFVKNINDDPPQFRPSQISVSFKETSRQAVIKELPVIDLDEDASLSYQIAWNTSEGLDPQQRRVSTNVLKSNFMMLPNSNTLMTSAMGLDRESVESANLVIVVTDINAANGTHQTAQGTVRIQVEDADDNSPQFSRSVFNANLTEGSPRGTPLQLDYEMTVTDIDKDENSEFHLTLSKYGNCLEVIPEHRRSEATVLIRVKNKSCFDYEDKELMEFEVIATGEQNASRTNSASVHLNILNVNDVTPVFNHSSYAVSVPENLAISSSVISVQAVDLDKPPFDSFNYSIQGGDGVFKISESGEVTVAKNELDYELRKEYQLTVEATDTGGRRASARLVITVEDVNDQNPRFIRPEYQAFVKEKEPDFDRDVIVKAEDSDGPGGNSEVYYSFPPSLKWSANFSINDTSGQLVLESPLDYEALSTDSKGVITLEILASDRGTPHPLTGSATIKVTVQDVNDNAPVFTSTEYSGNISENKGPDVSVVQVNATDNDRSSPNKDVFYIIASGGNDRFRVNSTSGEITTVTDLDREDTSNYTLTVLAMDRGSPALTGTTTVSVFVKNINDDPPQFRPSQISVSFKETSRQAVIKELPVIDLDEDASLSYQIAWNTSEGLDPQQRRVSTNVLKSNFMMLPNSNTLMTSAMGLDRESVESANLVIVVTDINAANGTHQTAQGTVRIQVEDADDNSPQFSRSVFNANLTEGSPRGTPLQLDYEMTVTDIDKDENSEFHLTLSKYGNCLEVIPEHRRSEATVLIRVKNKSCFDYEDKELMEFEVIATGEQNASRTNSASVHLNILNVNDVTPVFNHSSYAVSVPENLAISSSVISVQAVDLDKPPFDSFNYSIQGGDGVFKISESGEVTVAKNELDYELRKEYQLTVEATDTGGRRASARLVITVEDVNDQNPRFIRPEYQAFVKEKEPDFDRDVIVKAEDSDGLGGNSEVYYSFPPSLKWSANFSINDTSGQLVLESPLDYEALSTDSKGVITLEILASDRGTPHPLTGSATIKVTVQDVNDNAPVFTSTEYSGNVSENKGPDVSVVQINATDNDRSSPNKDVFYIIASGGNDRFRVNSTSGEITTVTDLDRENTSNYTLTVLAMDRGSPALTGTTTVSVFVKNINDDPPQFRPSQISVSFKETSRQAVIKELPVIDLDEDASLSYQIAWNTSEGLDPQQRRVSTNVLKSNFMMLPNSNTLMTSAMGLDREAVESANLVIVVTDINAANGTHQTAQGTVRIQVEDADDNSPQFSRSVFNANLTEGSPRGTPLQLDYEMTVTDIDKDENSEFHLTLSKYGNCLEVIPEHRRSEATVLIRVKNKSCFDYEDKELMEFEVIATGEQNATRTNSTSVHLNILNINDVTPVFNHSSYAVSVPENLAISSSVIRVQAVDLDKPPFDSFNYSIQGGDGVFKISGSGEVTVAKNELDYEQRKEYQLTVEATDIGGRRGSARLVITVQDVNDEYPKFSQPEYQAFVKEKESDFDQGVIVKAEDRDGTIGNSEVYYSFPPSFNLSANFSINGTSGQLVLESPLDYEALSTDSKGVITLEILASDRGTPRPLTGSATIKVKVQDVNDCDPVFSQTSYNGTVMENEAGGTQVAVVSATDNDGSPPNNDVFFLLSSGGNDQFRINSTSGSITTVQELDREAAAAYSLKVLAVDRGSPARTSSVTVIIDVINVNDDLPKFQLSDVTVSLMEGLSPGSLVFNFTADDRDENADLVYTVLWNISEGFKDDQAEVSLTTLKDTFKIDNTTGAIRVNKYLDRETLEIATLHVFVQDLNAGNPNPQTAMGKLSIRVEDADDNPPRFSTSSFNASISENSPEGTPVQFDDLMSLLDKDKDANSRFNLTLTEYADCLKIIPSAARAQTSVVIQVNNRTCFDYETLEFMEFEVLAMPYVNASNIQRAFVHLNIINVNDETPKFPQRSYAANVSENITDPDHVIIKVKATDIDSPPYNSVTYSLQGGSGRFIISNITGEVTVDRNVTLDFETQKEYLLRVEATDRGGRRDSVQLTISLLDVNDNSPVFLRPEYQAFIKENVSDSSLVVVKATDKDEGINQEIRYSISQSSELAGNFTLDATSGRLGTFGSSGLDYESLPNTATGVVNLTLTACDLGEPSLCSDVSLLITVSDENDHPPVFSQLLYHQNISEDARPGASLVMVSAKDDDGKPPNNNVVYLMAGGANDKFKIDSSTGLITRFGQLDSDTRNFYNLTISAIDGGSPALTATAYVVVHIIDVNDVIPTFKPQSRIISVNETSGRSVDTGRKLLTLWAIDTDVDSLLLYSMVWGESRGFGPNQELLELSVLQESFQINHSGSRSQIQVHSTLDRERLSRAVLVINVTDENAANSVAQTSTGTLTVNVIDLNDNKPTFNENHFTVEIQENSVKDSVLKMVSPEQMNVIDIDTDQNCVFNVSVIGPESAYFTAEPSTARSFALVQLRVRNSSVLDYETHHSINFTVQSIETDTSDRFNSTAFVTLNIIDVNDNDPVFDNDTYQASVPENSAKGFSFAHIQARDKDSGSFGNVTYTLGGDAERFSIDKITGVLSTADASLNRETKDTYFITVIATDGGGRRKPAPLQVTITDVNDEVPSFRANYSTSVLENTLVFNTPVTLLASDGDEEGSANSNLTYHLAHCTPVKCSNFSVNPITGELTIQSKLDYETTENVTLVVEARDQGSPQPRTGTAVVNISVRDDNDIDPVFKQNEYSANVTENAAEGTHVTMVEALDDDGERPNNVVFYVLDSGKGSDKFRINSTTGLITVGPGANLDREVEDGILHLTVLAIDRGDPPRSSTATVSVSLLDVNDEVPAFAEVRMEVKVFENARSGYELAIMNATDEDIDANLVYTWLIYDSSATTDRDAIVNISKVQDWFLVNPRTGQVTVNSVLDREIAEVITLRIMVNDTNGMVKNPQTASAILVITLRDVNDNAPLISGSSALQVSESLAANTEVASFSAQDKDRDQVVTFSILNGTDGSSFFNISAAGKIYLRQKIDREKTPEVTFIVIATDNGSPSLSSNHTVDVTVLDANDNTPRFDNTSYVFKIPEDAAIGITVAVVNATDADLGRNAEVTFGFADNVRDFAINRTTGEIVVKKGLNRENIPSYEIGVVALDNPVTYDTRSDTQQVIIQVTDINDNAPVFTNIDPDRHQGYSSQIDETSTVGTELLPMYPGSVTASDQDEGQNSNLSFYLSSRDNSIGLAGESLDQYLFRIDEITGKVFVNASIEGKAGTYNNTITVVDHGQPSALNSTANLTVVVKDKNINWPYFTGSYQNLSVPECAGIGTTIVTLHAQDDDRDKETNGRVQYFFDNSTANNADHAFFHLDKDSGELTSLKLFNRETRPVFNFFVKAQDMGLPRPFSSPPVRVNISIDDGNDEYPEFEALDYYFNITEEQAPSSVGTVYAVDKDTVKQTCYTLNGQLSKFFNIATRTDKPAELTLLSSLDRENEEQASFSLDITAIDCTPQRGDGCQQHNFQAVFTKVHITVVDINDNPPVFIRPQVTVGVTSTANTGHVIVDLQSYVTDRDFERKNRIHSFYAVEDYKMDKVLKSSFTASDRPLAMSTNGSIATFADLPRDAEGFFTWKIMVNDSAGNDTVILKIYVVGEDKLIRITFLKSMEELRQEQNEILSDLTNKTGLEFVADDRVAFEDKKGVVDPSRSVLVLHAIDQKNKVMPANSLRDFLDHAIAVTTFLKSKHKLFSIETFKAATAQKESKTRAEYILGAIICVLVIAFLITLFLMINNIRRFKRKLKAATIETYPMSRQAKEAFPGIKTPQTNPIFGKDEIMEKDEYSDKRSDRMDDNDSLDNNHVDIDAGHYNAGHDNEGDDEQEMTMDLYGEDSEDHVPYRRSDNNYYLNEALAEHERRKHSPHSQRNGVGVHHLGGVPVQNGKQQTVMLQQEQDYALDELESTEI